jgi:hypothetical protein
MQRTSHFLAPSRRSDSFHCAPELSSRKPSGRTSIELSSLHSPTLGAKGQRDQGAKGDLTHGLALILALRLLKSKAQKEAV